MSTLLDVRSVSKSFGQLRAVDGVSFTVETGEVFGIAGPNGAGKTTLFNLISGIPDRPDTGQVVFGGADLAGMPPHRICHLGIARTFQTETAFESLTVEENVRVAAVFGRRAETIDEAVREALAFVDLLDARTAVASTLPLHAKKRLMLATALATRPLLLMLDEPAAGLNRVEYRELETLIRRAQGAGLTIVLIEHVLPLLLSVSDRVLIMNQGRAVVQAPPDEIVRHPEVVEAYLGLRGESVMASIDDARD